MLSGILGNGCIYEHTWICIQRLNVSHCFVNRIFTKYKITTKMCCRINNQVNFTVIIWNFWFDDAQKVSQSCNINHFISILVNQALNRKLANRGFWLFYIQEVEVFCCQTPLSRSYRSEQRFTSDVSRRRSVQPLCVWPRRIVVSLTGSQCSRVLAASWGQSVADIFTQWKEKVSLQRSAEYHRRGKIHPTAGRTERSYL